MSAMKLNPAGPPAAIILKQPSGTRKQRRKVMPTRNFSSLNFISIKNWVPISARIAFNGI